MIDALPRLLSIGQFADRSGISCRMLRFYAERDLLVPASTDPRTGYRYYLASQLLEAQRLRLLRDADFSVKDMAVILNGLTPQELPRILENQRHALQHQMEALRVSLEVLDDLVRSDATASCTVVHTTDTPVLAVPVQANAYELRDRAQAAARPLINSLEDHHEGPSFPVICTYRPSENPLSAFVCVLLGSEERFQELPGRTASVQEHALDRRPVRTLLPGGPRATALHCGPYEDLPETLAHLLGWMDAQGFVSAGDVQEWYFPASKEQAPYGRVEISLPVAVAPTGTPLPRSDAHRLLPVRGLSR